MPITTTVDALTPDTSNPAVMPINFVRVTVDTVAGQNNLSPLTGQLWPRVKQT